LKVEMFKQTMRYVINESWNKQTNHEMENVWIFFWAFDFGQPSACGLAPLIGLLPKETFFQVEPAGLLPVGLYKRFCRTFSEIIFIDNLAQRYHRFLFEVAIDVVPIACHKHLKLQSICLTYEATWNCDVEKNSS